MRHLSCVARSVVVDALKWFQDALPEHLMVVHPDKRFFARDIQRAQDGLQVFGEIGLCNDDLGGWRPRIELRLESHLRHTVVQKVHRERADKFSFVKTFE